MMIIFKFMSLLVIIMFIILINFKNLNNKINNYNSLNSIECGFNNLNNKNTNMPINFIKIMILFIFFDLEFFILIPMFISNSFNYTTLMFLNFIILSLIYEIKNKNIKWML